MKYPQTLPSFSRWNPAQRQVGARAVSLAWRRLGPPGAPAWLVLHGGPGSGAQMGLLQPLDLARQQAIAPDQRGSGGSGPRGRATGVHLGAMVADIEALRRLLGLERWAGVLAGSWGTVLALAYGGQHAQRVERLVLRGAFALRWREVGGLLQTSMWARTAGKPCEAWPLTPRASGPRLLARLEQLLQGGTPGVSALRVVRQWTALERDCVARGQRASLRHAAGQGDAGLAASIRADWAALNRRQRKARALAARPRPTRQDKADLRKFRVQAHVLRRRGGLRPATLDRAVINLARAAVPLHWVHGRFDAVCPVGNSREGWALGERWAPGLNSLDETLSGHLAQEPQMRVALRRRVRP